MMKSFSWVFWTGFIVFENGMSYTGIEFRHIEEKKEI